MDLGLRDAVAVVTGGASGIGRATVEVLAAEGASVAVLDRNLESAALVAEVVSARGGQCVAVDCDVTDEVSVASAMSLVASQWGFIDHLVCCAGISPLYGKTIDEVQVAEWDLMMNVNVRGQWLPAKHALPYLKTRPHASITMVASDSALVAAPHDVAYCTSKGAVLMLTRALSVDLQEHGIRVNCVCPSIVDTEMSRRAMGRQDVGFVAQGYPVHDPADIGRYLALLASPVTATINGQAVVADFGYTAMSSFPA